MRLAAVVIQKVLDTKTFLVLELIANDSRIGEMSEWHRIIEGFATVTKDYLKWLSIVRTFFLRPIQSEIC